MAVHAGNGGAQAALIRFDEDQPSLVSDWAELAEDTVVGAFVELLCDGLREHEQGRALLRAKALIAWPHHLVEGAGPDAALQAISLRDESDLRVDLARLKMPYQKERDQGWLQAVLRRTETPYTALCINAALGLSVQGRLHGALHAVHDTEDEPGPAPISIETFVLGDEPVSLPRAVALAAAAVEELLSLNGQGGTSLNRILVDAINVAGSKIDSSFVSAVADQLNKRIGPSLDPATVDPVDAFCGMLSSEDRCDWGGLSTFVADLARSHARSGLAVPGAVLDDDDPQVALAEVAADTLSHSAELSQAFAAEVRMSLVVARELGGAGSGPRTLSEIVAARTRLPVDPVLRDLACLNGPSSVQVHIDAVRMRSTDLAAGNHPAPADLVALHALVLGARDLDLIEAFTAQSPAHAILATVAYAGELTVSVADDNTPGVINTITNRPSRDRVTDTDEVDSPSPVGGTQLVGVDPAPIGRGAGPEDLLRSGLDQSSSRKGRVGPEPADDRDIELRSVVPKWTGGPLPIIQSSAAQSVPVNFDAERRVTNAAGVVNPEDARSVDGADQVVNDSREDVARDERVPEVADIADQRIDDAGRPTSSGDSAGNREVVDSTNSPFAGTQMVEPLVAGDLARDVFITAVRTGRFGAASHVAAATNPRDAELWRFVALADAVAAGTGPLAGAINATVGRVVNGSELAVAGGERGAVEVAYLAAVRAALVAPLTPATSVLAAAARSLPDLETFTEAVVQTARQGVALIDHVLSQAADLSDAERRVEDAASAARVWQAQTLTRSIKYHRATEVLRIIVADNGPIGSLCAMAGKQQDDAARRNVARQVMTRVNELRDDRAASDAFDAAHVRAFEIHSGARTRLLSYWNEGLDAAADWASAVVDFDAAREVDDDAWQASFLRRLQAAQGACAPILDALVQDLQTDSSDTVSAAGDACRHLLDSIRSLLVGERPGRMLDQAEAVINVDLLAVDRFRLGPDWKVIVDGDLSRPEVLAQLGVALQDTTTAALRDAFDRRLEAEDHVGTRLCVEAIAQLGSVEAEGLEDLSTRDAAAEDAARAAVTDIWRDTEDLLAADARLGYLDETTRRAWTADLYSADPSHRIDIGSCRLAIEVIRERSARNREERMKEIRSEIAAVAAEEPAVAAGLDRVLARVDAGDLATAWEYISLAREGIAIPEPPEPPIDIREFFPARDEAIARTVNLRSRAVASAAGSGQQIGPLDFGGLSAADKEAARDGFVAWRAMSNVARPGKEYTEWASHLPKVLAALGLTADRLERSPITGDREHDRLWVDLIGISTTGDPIVPAFAPDAGGRRVVRLLAITGGHDAGQIEAAIERDRSGDPVLVLHHGPLGPALRAESAERFRESGRAVAVIDDDLFAHLLVTGARRYERTMGLVLPFTTTNPYHLDVSGLVPETMFFGRRAERDAIMDRFGTSHLYGGRQLGKSALLRHVERVFNSTPNQVAIYVDLKGAQVGMPRPPEAVFDVLWGPLVTYGIVEGDLPASNVPEVIAAAIDHWLDGQPGRRLLVLLDECDNFLKADKDRDLATSARLKDLMERTDRACKFVFAGLHTVQRFSSVANTPMAHLGTPIAIGPLDGAAAAELITKPLHALGYRFSDPELVNRTLAHTSRHPALLVIFCHHLLRKLQSRRRLTGEPPFAIAEVDVDGTWADAEVSAAIRERVQWTLALDPAYEVITYVIAHLASTEGGGPDHRVPVRDLQAECTYWWPAGFDGYLPEQFRLLADELIGLGVLAREGSRYGLRNPNVARLLGTEEEIETVLAGAHLKQPEQTFEPATWRRPVPGPDGSTFRAPLSHEQLDQLTAPGIFATVVVGTEATGIERVAQTIDAAAGGRTKVTPRGWRDPIESMLRPVGQDRHRIAVIDLRGAPHANAAAILDAVADAVDPDHPRSGSPGTWSAILVVDAARDGSILRHAMNLPALGLAALQRWTPAAISAFGRDAGYPFAGTDQAAAVSERTGGWGYLVDRVAEKVAGATTLSRALDEADSGDLLIRVGLDEDPVLAAAFDVASGLVTGPEDGCDLPTLADLIEDSSAVTEAIRVATASDRPFHGTTGAMVAEQLLLAALLDAGGGGSVWVEPIAREAFTKRRTS